MRRDELFGAAAAVAARVHGATVAAVAAEVGMAPVVAVVGCLLAGVPVVPVPPDAGPKERAHLLGDSGAALWLGAPPADGAQVPPTVGVDMSARSAANWRCPRRTCGGDRPHLGNHRQPEGRDDLASGAGRMGWTAWRGPGHGDADDVLVHGVAAVPPAWAGPWACSDRCVSASPVVHTVRPRPDGYARAATDHGGTMFFGVPTVWARIAAQPQQAHGALALSSAVGVR